jgi:hypothetical protein
MRWPLVAIAMTMAISYCADSARAQTTQPADVSSPTAKDLGSGGAFGEEDWLIRGDRPQSVTAPTVQPLELHPDATLVAPLPPAIFMGPLGIGLVALASYRLRKKGL